MSKRSHVAGDVYVGQRYDTYTAHRTGQPYGGLGPWLHYQQEKANANRNTRSNPAA